MLLILLPPYGVYEAWFSDSRLNRYAVLNANLCPVLGSRCPSLLNRFALNIACHAYTGLGGQRVTRALVRNTPLRFITVKVTQITKHSPSDSCPNRPHGLAIQT